MRRDRLRHGIDERALWAQLWEAVVDDTLLRVPLLNQAGTAA